MSRPTSIEWCTDTWNPVTGCTRVSAGCDNCYAARQAATRLSHTRQYQGLATITPSGRAAFNGTLRFLPERLTDPLRWKKPRRIFVNSMSDLFHERVSDDFIAAVFGIMAAAWQHTFLVLTKRPERARFWFADHVGTGDVAEPIANGLYEYSDGDEESVIAVANYVSGWSRWRAMPDDGNPLNGTLRRWPLPNVWLGVSVEDQATADERIPLLLDTPASVRWVSAEPLLGPIQLDQGGALEDGPWLDEHGHGLNWVVIGGESGPGARPFDVTWARQILKQCATTKVPAFVKQLGARPHSPCDHFGLRQTDIGGGWEHQLRDKKGGDPEEWPHDLRVREYPA
jgi:protein gp37